MLALILFAAAAVAIGAAVPRWWVVPLPLMIAAAWVLYAAAVGGEDRDGMPVWQLAAFFGGWLAGAGMLGLVLGVVLGRWARDRRIARALSRRNVRLDHGARAGERRSRSDR